MKQRVKEVQESDLRMDGALARNIQRVLAVTQADINTAAAAGKSWLVKPVIKVNDPIDNLQGGTQLVIKQNSITPGQNVMRVMYVAGPSVDVTVKGVPPLVLPDALAEPIVSLKAFGGCTQSDTPTPSDPVDIVCNNGTLKARYSNGLPLTYQPLEYVSYIGAALSLGIDGFDDDTSEIYLEWKTDSPSVESDYQGIFTVWSANTYNSWRMLTYLKQTDKYYVYGNSRNPSTASNVAIDTWHTISCKSGEFKIDNNTYNPTVTSSLTRSDVTLKIGGTASLNSYYKYIKVKRQGEWIANFVPAKRLSDDKVGLYDTITDTFKTSTSFTAGSTASIPVEVYADGTVETININSGNYYQPTTATATDYFVPQADGTILCQGTPTSYQGLVLVDSSEDVSVLLNNVVTFTKLGNSTNTKLNLYIKSGNTNLAQFDISTTKTIDFPTDYPTADNINLSVARQNNNVELSGYVKPMITIGSAVPTEYVQYFDGGTATCEDLLSVGTYTDEQEVISGAITRNVGVKVLDGTGNWQQQISGGTYRYYLLLSDGVQTAGRNEVLCSHFVYASSGNPQFSTFLFGQSNASYLYIIPDQTITTAADFKQWLSGQYENGTPVIVVYPLETPTTGSVTGQPMSTVEGDNTAEITQASMSGLELEVTYQAGVALTVEEVEDAQLSPDVEVTIE